MNVISINNDTLAALRSSAAIAGNLDTVADCDLLADERISADYDGREVDIYKDGEWAGTGTGTDAQGCWADLGEDIFGALERILDTMVDAAAQDDE